MDKTYYVLVLFNNEIVEVWIPYFLGTGNINSQYLNYIVAGIMNIKLSLRKSQTIYAFPD